MSTDNSLPLTIGLTGGIGSGKSNVSQFFAELGVPVIDTDQLSRELVKPGSPLLSEISKYFGNEILLPSGNLDRNSLRKKIFANPDKKQWLEQLLHPKIKELLLTQLTNYKNAYVVIVVPLLLESTNYNFINRVLVVDCSEELQLKRTAIRDQSKVAEIKKIINSQMPRTQRLSLADDIIVNQGSLNSLREKVLELHEKYQQLND
ncbi:MAG: dephospho-CoA kinase [SAR86 cluster bacterium]|uniref:Dephospho-CoA kinase n=1 Tax=SAR86 cluster bacterium TaxID=2030880 RepID=A0A2A5CA19_9GAMM|nr:MAG: dephospho-CoA kinase [SAR86 cluster bacterium]